SSSNAIQATILACTCKLPAAAPLNVITRFLMPTLHLRYLPWCTPWPFLLAQCQPTSAAQRQLRLRIYVGNAVILKPSPCCPTYYSASKQQARVPWKLF